MNDDATNPTEILTLKQAYEGGYPGLMFTYGLGETLTAIIRISAVDEDKLGMSEEERAQAEIEEASELAEMFGVESDGSEMITVTLADEDHIAIYDKADPERLGWFITLTKDGLEYIISLEALDEDGLNELLAMFEKAD